MATVEPLIIGKQKGGKIVAIYNHSRAPIYTIAVQADSPIKQLEDLKGKRIGVLSLSSGAVPFSKAMLSSVGVEPEKGVTWLPTGIGQQSVHAIKSGQIDALAYWDWAYAMMENAGVQLRHFTTPATKNVLSLAIVANEEFIAANPDATMKFAQGIAKAALFTITNPEAAVRIHWEKYPAVQAVGSAGRPGFAGSDPYPEGASGEVPHRQPRGPSLGRLYGQGMERDAGLPHRTPS